MAGSEERTEKATGKKRGDERKKGNIFMSKDVVTIVSLVSSFYIMRAFIMSFLTRMEVNYQNQMMRAQTIDRIAPSDLTNLFVECAIIIATTVIPAMMIIGFLSILATGFQTKFLFARERIKFKLKRLNPLKGIQNLFSLKAVVELVKSLVKISIIIAIVYNRIISILRIIPASIDFDIMQAAVYTGESIMSILTTVAIAFAGIAAFDYIYQKWDYEKGIKMTKQEVKDEYKQMEGDPKVKSARRRKQQEMAQQRMMSNVKEADVVVRNPTHFAVALRYRTEEDAAPVVLAKGADLVAARIVAEAEKHGIVTVENPPLARGIFNGADVYDMIPAEFFQPVAELLAWIYSSKEKEKKKKIPSAPADVSRYINQAM